MDYAIAFGIGLIGVVAGIYLLDRRQERGVSRRSSVLVSVSVGLGLAALALILVAVAWLVRALVFAGSN